MLGAGVTLGLHPSVDIGFWSSGKMEPMWITAVFTPCGGVCPTLLCAELFLLLNLNFVCGKSLAANASLQTTLSSSCFSKYFWLWSPFFLSPFLTSFIPGGQPLYMAQAFPLSAPEPTADIANGHHIPFFLCSDSALELFSTQPSK